ncbi:alpha/beta fold hydrolase [Sporomusa sphaeroides]|uniref:Haloalkane dehalogenase n=1 Tax=Sporomusa sphaeroides DSM 2875 TaxID=1337886 RepID=A0ABP2CAU6_9FIRM|nr:alpha/beta hydrolase [Sporomusa sphaeroides]OLS55391.1 soluble epoxide hydrolase [Sporomusa sphaeroides DSM 2875]CVK21417.1 haloalkane dehalogenase [Sporomusa sphaeroides DSM 2875]
MRNLVNIGNKNIEVMLTGEGQCICILPGMASSMDEWEIVVNGLAKQAKVIVFHRAGCGKSELGEEKKNTNSTVNDLYKLLGNLDIHDPVILVGHSYGGLCVQHFAISHPNYVSAVILVEANSTEMHLLNDAIGSNQNKHMIEIWRLWSKMEPAQINSKLSSQSVPDLTNFSVEARERILQFKINPKMYQAMAEEMEELENSAQAIRVAGSFPQIPLTVIGRDPDYSFRLLTKQGMPEQLAKKIEDVWQELITKQLDLSKNSKYIEAEQSGHGVHIDRPDIIINAVLSVIS